MSEETAKIEVEPEKEQFEITDDLTANWAFQKLAEDESKLKELKNKRDAFIQQANEWFKKNSTKIIDQRDYIQSKINDYRLTKEDGKVNVPAGQTITRHTNKPVYDDKKLIEYVKTNNPDLLKYSVDKSAFKKTITNVNGNAVDENGQIVDGIKFEANESVSFKLNK